MSIRWRLNLLKCYKKRNKRGWGKERRAKNIEEGDICSLLIE